MTHPPAAESIDDALTPSIRREKLYDTFVHVPLVSDRDRQGRPISKNVDLLWGIAAGIIILILTVAAYAYFVPLLLSKVPVSFEINTEINRVIWSYSIEILLLLIYALISDSSRERYDNKGIAHAAIAKLTPTFNPNIREMEYIIQRMENKLGGNYSFSSWLLNIQPFNFVVFILVGLLGSSILSIIEVGSSEFRVTEGQRLFFFAAGTVGIVFSWVRQLFLIRDRKRTDAALEYLEILRDQQDAPPPIEISF